MQGDRSVGGRRKSLQTELATDPPRRSWGRYAVGPPLGLQHWTMVTDIQQAASQSPEETGGLEQHQSDAE